MDRYKLCHFFHTQIGAHYYYIITGYYEVICESLLCTFPCRRCRTCHILWRAHFYFSAAATLIAYGAQTINHNGTTVLSRLHNAKLVAITRQKQSKAKQIEIEIETQFQLDSYTDAEPIPNQKREQLQLSDDHARGHNKTEN